MDIRPQKPHRFRSPETPEEALLMVQQAVVEAQAGYAKALAPLTRGEIGELERNLYPVMTASCVMGHTIEDRPTGRRLCDLLEKVDRSGFYDAADALVPLADPRLLDQLAKLPEEGDVKVEGVQGTVLRRIVTSAGTILVGGRGKNVYELDELPDVCAVIDLGGDDEYYEGSCNFSRPVLVILDLAGDDAYRGTQPGIQGGAVLGVSMLLDRQGNDTYRGPRRGPGVGPGRRSASSSTVAAAIPIAGCGACRARPWEVSACSWTARGRTTRTTSTPPCGARASAIPSVSA